MKKKLAVLGVGKHVVKNVLPNICHCNTTFDVVFVRLLGKTKSLKDAEEISYSELLKREDIEAVYNCLPNALHVPKTMELLKANKHVLCEKPFGLNLNEVKEALDLSLEKNLVLREAFMYQHHKQLPVFLNRIKQWPSLKSIDLTFSYCLKDEKNVRFSKSLGGGIFYDASCYCFHLLQKLGFYHFDKIEAFKRTHPLREVDIYYFILLFQGETRISIELSMDGYREQSCVVKGVRAAARMSHPFLSREGEKTSVEIREFGKSEVLKFYSNPVYLDQLDWFLKEVEQGRTLFNEEILKNAQLMEDIKNMAKEI